VKPDPAPSNGSEASLERRGGTKETPASVAWTRPSTSRTQDVLAQLRALRSSASRIAQATPEDACVPLETSFGVVPLLQTQLETKRTRPRWTDTEALLAEMRQKRQQGHALYTRAHLDEKKASGRCVLDESRGEKTLGESCSQPRVETFKPYSRTSSTAEIRMERMRRLSDAGRRLCRVQSSPEAR